MSNEFSLVPVRGLRYDLQKITAAIHAVVAAAAAVVAPEFSVLWNRNGLASLEQAMSKLPPGADAGCIRMPIVVGRLNVTSFPIGQDILSLNTDFGIFVTEFGEPLDQVDPAPGLLVGTKVEGQSQAHHGLTKEEAEVINDRLLGLGLGLQTRLLGQPRVIREGGITSMGRTGYVIAVALPHSSFGDGLGDLMMLWDGRTTGRQGRQPPEA